MRDLVLEAEFYHEREGQRKDASFRNRTKSTLVMEVSLCLDLHSSSFSLLSHEVFPNEPTN